MNIRLATLWSSSALLCAAHSGCSSPPPPPPPAPQGLTTPTITPVCPMVGMPFMVSTTGTKPEALLCEPPGDHRAFQTSASYGGLNLTTWLNNKDVDAFSWGLDWLPTEIDGRYWHLLSLAPGGPGPTWEGWGAILYGDSQKIYAYAWGDATKLAGLSLSMGHQLLHDVTDFGITPPIDAIDYDAWAFSGPPSALCYAPFPPAAGKTYDPTLVYSILRPPTGGNNPDDSGATLFGVKAVLENGTWGWQGPFIVATPTTLGLALTDEVDTLAYDRRQGLLMYSLADTLPQTHFMVMRVQEVPHGNQFTLTVLAAPKELETSGDVKFSVSGPLIPKPSTACAIDPSRFNWAGRDADLKEKSAAAR